MAYQCPRCGGNVQRGSSTAAGAAGGLVGALLFAAFGAFQCKQCGKIPSHEFPPHVRSRMRTGSIMMIVVAVVLLVAVTALVIALQN
jgi:hypothetical protein